MFMFGWRIFINWSSFISVVEIFWKRFIVVRLGRV